MCKKDTPNISSEESKLFRESVTDVKPLNAPKRNTQQSPLKSRSKSSSTPRNTLSPIDSNTTEHTSFVESEYVTPVGANELLVFSVTGVQPKTQKKLRQGRFNIDHKIDLHGLTAAQSGLKLDQCITASIANADRCLLLIHGKASRSAEGYPVLKSHVNQWLRHCPSVLAFVSALPKDGGAGAMYVLLKQNR